MSNVVNSIAAIVLVSPSHLPNHRRSHQWLVAVAVSVVVVFV